ncbi:peroxidase [Marchantia polymorpha subsp. ruderalis]|uniref:Peroxidase n=2 Tax=Marchantia polymorpha TaxID=3197 RepID=A0A176VHP9_MARPO|nr:hypothetical protein AXG93_1860s1250 [Marchantia polymorpha subsp. ruderalis]PTQ35634.1 hypothetical protein MARPO_0070s0094 [Marchantia polymorpha]BBN08720.1 hypothetical protein Mp_4g13870 [Marchantia polymorpha subsp. ruderalis]|eukprot:PTQ35634.1 hypothetical protein MARPO_0070s0094 [Marchantia polymorpha]
MATTLFKRATTALVIYFALFVSPSYGRLTDDGNNGYYQNFRHAIRDPVDFYKNECPSARELVGLTVLSSVWKDKTTPAALLRLQFHDCFVRGCDASILLDSNQTNLAEKDGVGNAFSVRGFDIIDTAKAAVEKACPGVVSCADIITLAARDSIVMIGGPSWRVVSGRRDGLVSRAVETPSNLPPPFADYPFLVSIFAKKNMTEKEMVILSGAHTIGKLHCGLIEARLYNSTGPDGVDPTLDPVYAKSLKEQCPFGEVMREILLDPTEGGYAFDSQFYSNVLQNRGVFTSDAALITSATGREIVTQAASGLRRPWFGEFSAAMEKMSNIGVIKAPEGEIRRHCRFAN